MATREEFRDRRVRQNRYFSESFKKAKVKEIENNLSTAREVSKGYQVSGTAIYKWLYKYSLLYKKQLKQVVEPMSDTRKIQELKLQIKELERLVGQNRFK